MPAIEFLSVDRLGGVVLEGSNAGAGDLKFDLGQGHTKHFKMVVKMAFLP